jgi:hypothetical protein
MHNYTRVKLPILVGALMHAVDSQLSEGYESLGGCTLIRLPYTCKQYALWLDFTLCNSGQPPNVM